VIGELIRKQLNTNSLDFSAQSHFISQTFPGIEGEWSHRVDVK